MTASENFLFAPQLYIKSGTSDIGFYEKAFGAAELRRWENDDGTVHVAKLAIGDLTFHLHEDNDKPGLFEPGKHHGTPVTIGLFVHDVDEVIKNSKAAGAREISPAKDYEYGYRQAEIEDPFGHCCLIEKKSE